MKQLLALLILLTLPGCVPAGEDAIVVEMTEAVANYSGSTASAAQFDSPTTTPEQSVPIIEAVDLQPMYDMDIQLHYVDRYMQVEQAVMVMNSSMDTWDEIVFNVAPASFPDSFYLDSLSAVINGMTYDLYESANFVELTMLHIRLPEPAPPGSNLRIAFSYRVLIPPVGPSDWPPTGNTGWNLDLIQAGEFYPSLVPYANSTGWLTWEYVPVGDMAVYPLSDYQIAITTEPEVIIAAAGFTGKEGDTWRYAIENGRGIAFFASEFYECAQSSFEDIPITSCYLPDYEESGKYALTVAENSLELFTDLFGPYPYSDLVIVENGFFGGMEYTGLASITGSAYYSYTGKENSILTVLTAHEIAHQWFYGAVGNDQVRESWMDESIGFYSELLYIQRYHPHFERWWWNVRVDRFKPQGTVDGTVYEYTDSASFILWMYGQAAYFMSDARDLMGDEAFFSFLRNYYEANQWQTATKHDFLSVMQAQTDQDLTPLLERYFEFPEY